MREVQPVLQPAETEPPAKDLRLLIPDPPWHGIFLQNLRDFFRRPEVGPVHLESARADFWPDVFVNQRLPWGRFLQSGMYHVLALVAIWEGSQLLDLRRPVIAQPMFSRSDVAYYTPSEYLPPLDTRRRDSDRTRKADPEYSAQPIISVPRQADNRSQTLVTPPNIRLGHDVATPNVVALLEKASDPRMPIGPTPAVPTSEISRVAPTIERSVIAPPPLVQAMSREDLGGPQPAVIAPPPEVHATAAGRLGDLNIGRSSVIPPAPQISLDEQRALAGRDSSALSGRAAQVIAPPPSLRATGGSRSGRGLIALSLYPAVGAPPNPPAGNRRGTFAATPEGHRGASGAPGTSAGNGNSDASGAGKNGASGLPTGLYVGKTSNDTSRVAGDPASNTSSAYSVNPRLLANARSPRASARTIQRE